MYVCAWRDKYFEKK